MTIEITIPDDDLKAFMPDALTMRCWPSNRQDVEQEVAYAVQKYGESMSWWETAIVQKMTKAVINEIAAEAILKRRKK